MNAGQSIRKAVRATLGLSVAVGLCCGLSWSKPAETAAEAAASSVELQARKCVVAFDPGHGGRDSGAAKGGIREKDVNWKVANLAAEILQKDGFGTVIDRAENQNPEFDERVSVAYRAGATLMVSISFEVTVLGQKSKALDQISIPSKPFLTAKFIARW